MNNKYLLGPAVVVTSRRIYVLALVFLFTSAAGTATSTIGGKNGKVLNFAQRSHMCHYDPFAIGDICITALMSLAS